MKKKYLSLCIPTNGIVEWIRPVLDSIYTQGIDDSLFEVVITDNGKESVLEENIQDYLKEHENLRYFKTSDFMFLNQIGCFKRATGELIKFINHRMILEKGALQILLDTAEKYVNEKPILYFLNKNKTNANILEYNNFNDFVGGLSYFSSWSAGLAIWKSDLALIPDNYIYNELFPHTDLLFMVTDRSKYIINNENLMKEQNSDNTKKGRYNLFNAFSVEYLSIILKLLREKKIDYNVFLNIKNDLFDFIKELYFQFVFLKRPCSYELSNIKESLCVFYEKNGYQKLKNSMLFLFLKKGFHKIFRGI